jgi:hypothetical protein
MKPNKYQWANKNKNVEESGMHRKVEINKPNILKI